MSTSYGWAGKILRVNLSTGKISVESTDKYKNLIGGMGIGYKVMFDEVPVGTKAFDEANKIVFAVGPLTGSGAPSSSRTNITSLFPTNPYNAVGDSHMGGNFASQLKYAGYDAIIIEGKSSRPVWLNINDDKVTLEDASFVWGKGIKESTAKICSLLGKEASVACIGQAGENMVNLSVIMNGLSHSAGGHGGVLGSKNLKAISVIGTGPVNVKGNKRTLSKLNDYMMKDIIGANNQHVVPSTPQPWAEYHSPGSRWTAKEGLTWGAAEGGPIETGICEAGDVGKVGYRTMKAVFDLGPSAEKYTVRMGGCQSCPIRCMSQLKIPKLQDYGLSPYVANTCMGYHAPKGVMFKGFKDIEEKGDGQLFAGAIGASVADDYGVWCNYGLIGKDLQYGYESGIFKKVLPADEYNSIPWDKLEAGDPTFLIDFYRRIALKEGEFSNLGLGSYWSAKRWNYGDDYWNGASVGMWSKLGFPKHHANETNGQVGSLINSMFNRDAQSHTLVNLWGSGLPTPVLKEIVAEIVGSGDAIDAPKNYTPMNQYKAKFAKWCILRNCLHDSLTLCNWMWPMTVSPKKERNYRGDIDLEAKFMSVVTGEDYTAESLDLAAERVFTLHRALTVKNMNTIDMRNKHDGMSDWVFDKDPDLKPFTPGTDKMDKEDMQVALTMFYREMGWDEKTGAPTKATLERLGLGDVAVALGKLNLLP